MAAVVERAPRRQESLAWVAWLKLIAIIGVVTIHAVGLNAVEEGALATGRGRLAAVLYYGSMFCVPLFVMINGALLLDAERYRGASHFLRRRASRLVPPLVFWHVWYLCLIHLTWSEPPGLSATIGLVVTGKLYTALYFFWIVLGLAVLVPVLIPFSREASPRAVLVLTAAALAIPVLTSATRMFRSGSQDGLNMPWTWWLPYLGAFLLGHVLKKVTLRGWRLLVAGGGLVVLLAIQVLQGTGGPIPSWVRVVSPPGYYGLLLLALTALIFVVIKSLVEQGGALAVLGRGGIGRLVNRLAGTTMGVFGLHLTLLYLARRYVFAEDGQVPDSMPHMLVRTTLVLVLAFAIVLPLRRLPFARRVV